jgi:hypothetical protein
MGPRTATAAVPTAPGRGGRQPHAVGPPEVLGVPLLLPSIATRSAARVRAGLARLYHATAPPPARVLEAALGGLDPAVLAALCILDIPDRLHGPTTVVELATSPTSSRPAHRRPASDPRRARDRQQDDPGDRAMLAHGGPVVAVRVLRQGRLGSWAVCLSIARARSRLATRRSQADLKGRSSPSVVSPTSGTPTRRERSMFSAAAPEVPAESLGDSVRDRSLRITRRTSP